MTTPDEEIKVEPAEIKWQAQYDEGQSQEIKLTNENSEKHVVFRIKTTLPDTYAVKPKEGFIGPKETISVEISMGKVSYNEAKTLKHKFLVETLYIDGDCKETDVNQIFRNGDVPGIVKLNADLPEP